MPKRLVLHPSALACLPLVLIALVLWLPIGFRLTPIADGWDWLPPGLFLAANSLLFILFAAKAILAQMLFRRALPSLPGLAFLMAVFYLVLPRGAGQFSLDRLDTSLAECVFWLAFLIGSYALRARRAWLLGPALVAFLIVFYGLLPRSAAVPDLSGPLSDGLPVTALILFITLVTAIALVRPAWSAFSVLGRRRSAALIVLALPLIGGAALFTMQQRASDVRVVRMQQRFLGQLVEQAPTLPDQTTVVIDDQSGRFDDPWFFGTSARLTQVIRALYRKPTLNAQICHPNETPNRDQTICHFTENVLEIRSPGKTGPLVIPKSQTVRFQYGTDGQLSLEQVAQAETPSQATADWFACWPIEPCTALFSPPIQTLAMDDRAVGLGWKPAEHLTDGSSARWSIATLTTLNVHLPVERSLKLTLRIRGASDAVQMDNLKIKANGQALVLDTTLDSNNGWLVTAFVPRAVLAANPLNTELTFALDHLYNGTGFALNWLRANPLPDRLRLEFDQPVTGSGWRGPEALPDRTSFQWTIAKQVTLDVPISPDRDLKFKCRLLMAAHSGLIDTMRVQVNGQPVPLKITRDTYGAAFYTGVIPHDLLSVYRPTRFTFITTDLAIPQGGSQALGVAFDWLTLDPP